MKGKRFARNEKIPKNTFQKGFQDEEKCWHKCIIFEGDYFEGDKVINDKKNKCIHTYIIDHN